ncbi:hypothetical protein KM043_015340 [Ampulex compressa]|nr:hypothetical protein KM043_015340 [Ampulex compressa]
MKRWDIMDEGGSEQHLHVARNGILADSTGYAKLYQALIRHCRVQSRGLTEKDVETNYVVPALTAVGVTKVGIKSNELAILITLVFPSYAIVGVGTCEAENEGPKEEGQRGAGEPERERRKKKGRDEEGSSFERGEWGIRESHPTFEANAIEEHSSMASLAINILPHSTLRFGSPK